MALDAVGDTSPAYQLARLPVDVGAWKRRLANILLGQAAPEMVATYMRGQATPALALQLKGTAFEKHPAFMRLAKAEQAAQAEAAQMITALGKKDWDTGTPAYRAVEAAMAEMLKAADELMAAHQGI